MDETYRAEDDPVVTTITAYDEKLDMTRREIRYSEVRGAPVGTVFSVGNESDGESVTVAASSGKEKGGVGLIVETRSALYGTTDRAAVWLSDSDPVREDAFPRSDDYGDMGTVGRILEEGRSSPMEDILTDRDSLQKELDLLREAVSPDVQRKIEEEAGKNYLRLWMEPSDREGRELWYSHENGIAPAPDPVWPSVKVADIRPPDRIRDALASHCVAALDVIYEIDTGLGHLGDMYQMYIPNALSSHLGTALQKECRDRPINTEEERIAFLKRHEEEIFQACHCWPPDIGSRFVKRQTVERPAGQIRERIGALEQKMLGLTEALSNIPEIPKIKRMAFEQRLESFTRCVDKDIGRYIREVPPFDLEKDKQVFLIPKDFYRKIEKARDRTAPDWRKDFYRTANVRDEIGDESKYRVSIPPGGDAVLRITGGQKGLHALKEDLRKGYLRDVVLDAERLDPKYDRARAERYVEVNREIADKETICHELSSPSVHGGPDVRAYFQKDLAKLRLERDQIAADLKNSPALPEKTFERYRKNAADLGLSGARAVTRMEARIRHDPYTHRASAPYKVIEELETKYGLKTADHIRGFKMDGRTCSWDVPPNSTPLRELGISRADLTRAMTEDKARAVADGLIKAIEHPEPQKEKKRFYGRSRELGR